MTDRSVGVAGAELTRHGVAAPRGQASPPGSRDGRFGRMFPHLPRPDPGNHAIEQLARAMLAIAGQPGDGDIRLIPAGYTYLGQFIDHDITFDPTSKLQRDNDPHALVNFRSPRFDLDSLYGSGPRDQPFLYDWDDASHPGVKLLAGDDMPRNARGRALLGDARNDENIIVSQLHLLFANFHNAVVERLRHSHPSVGAVALFEDAQRLVRWHYQWIVVHDFLRRVAGDDVVEARGPSASRLWRGEPSIPVEFSAAAFRFGHSMVRDNYALNAHSGAVSVLRPDRGFGPLPPELVIDWERFFEIEDAPFPSMRSMRINTSLVAALSHLPPDGAALARLNLERGRALGLPAGRDVAAALLVPPLADDELLLEGIDDRASEALLSATPLWYYVLREAEMTHFEGRRLGPVGGRIVAEVLVGLLEGDPHSYLRHWPAWSPELPCARDDTFTMGDLVSFARGHRHS